MRPKERRQSGQSDLFRARLDQIVDLDHPVVKLAAAIDWRFLEEQFGAVYTDAPGPPAAADAVDGGVGDPQAHARPLGRGAMRALGREPVLPAVLRRGVLLPSASVRPLVADALAPAHGGGQARRADPGEPARRDPHGSRQARGLPAGGHRHDRAGEGDCLSDRVRVGKIALIRHQRYAHAKQFKRATRALRSIRTMLGRVIRDITRKIVGRPELADVFALPLSRARRVKDQRQRQRGRKLYSLHAPEVECIGKGKAHKPYEFGVKVSVATPLNRCRGGQFVAHVKALPGNPYDGHTLAAVLPDIESTIGTGLERIVTDAGYKGHNAPKHQRFKVYVAGQKRGLTAAIKRAFRRLSAVEPTIGHLKNEHRMGRNHLAGRAGDAANAVLAAVGYNFGLLLRWLALLLRIVLAVLAASSHANRTVAAS